jgi:hypothetical protein
VQSEGVLVANRRSLLHRAELLPMVHELLERLEAHLTAEGFYSVTVNMRGGDPEKIATDMRAAGLGGLQGPTVSKVRCGAAWRLWLTAAGSARLAAHCCVPQALGSTSLRFGMFRPASRSVRIPVTQCAGGCMRTDQCSARQHRRDTRTCVQMFGKSDIAHAACVCVPKKTLYETVKKLRAMGGSGVLVSPMTYIFDEEPKRWHQLLAELGLQEDPMKA